MRRLLRALSQLALLAAVNLPAFVHAGTAEVRDRFAAAYSSAQAGVVGAEADDPPELVAYVLYPYLQAARLQAAITGLPADAGFQPVDARVRDFLAAHANEPVARLLRRPWLTSLAARRQWKAFLAAYAQARDPGQPLRCKALQAGIALGQSAGLREAATAEWLTGDSADNACDPVFKWLRASGALDDALIERRARLALVAGETRRARWLARSLPEATARPLRDWAVLLEDPRASFDALIRSPGTPVEFAALLDGWSRFSRRNPGEALRRFDPLVSARSLDAAQVSQLARALAVGLALSRMDHAVELFARVRPSDFDVRSIEWRVRAALWARNWQQVGSAIAAMPAPMQEEPRWRYWAARAAEAAGDTEHARQLYALVVPTDNWFAVLAAARLGQPFTPHAQDIPLVPAEIDAIEKQPAFQRAGELYALGLLPLAQAEWNAGYQGLGTTGQLASIGLAKRWGWQFEAIATAAKQGLFDDYRLLYPTPFDGIVDRASGTYAVSPTLIYAVIRQESLYQPGTVSPAGATGLMQLLGHTARTIASRKHLPQPSGESLAQPEVNIPLGTAMLADLTDRFDGQVLVALAGYNAGPGAALRWLPDHPMDADAWVENIPFDETRAYVQRVMWHSAVFKWLRDNQPEDAKHWLVSVVPVH